MMKNTNQFASEYGLKRGNVFLTFEELDLMRNVANECPHVLSFLNHVRKHTACISILKWLKENNLTGFKLFQWIRDENEGSFYLSIAKIIKKVEGNKRLRPLYFGKDFIP